MLKYFLILLSSYLDRCEKFRIIDSDTSYFLLYSRVENQKTDGVFVSIRASDYINNYGRNQQFISTID
jgi:hypothetical protein